MARKKNDEYSGDEEEPDFEDPEGFVDDITDEGRDRRSVCIDFCTCVAYREDLKVKKWTRKHFMQSFIIKAW